MHNPGDIQYSSREETFFPTPLVYDLVPIAVHVKCVMQFQGELDTLPAEVPRESADCSSWIIGARFNFKNRAEGLRLKQPWQSGRQFMIWPKLAKTNEVAVVPALDVREPVLVDHKCRSYLHRHPGRTVAQAVLFYTSRDAPHTCCGPYRDGAALEAKPRDWVCDDTVNDYELWCSYNSFPYRLTTRVRHTRKELSAKGRVGSGCETN